MTPVSGTASPNRRAWLRPFWPVVASSTSSVSCGASGLALPTTAWTLRNSSMRLCWVCRRPAVSISTTSAPRAVPAATASKATAPGSAPGPLAHQLRAGPIGPDRQLVDGRGTKGVRSPDDDLLAEIAEAMGELADGRRLAAAVDPDDEDDRRGATERDLGRLGSHLAGHRGGQAGRDLRPVDNPPLLGLLAELVHQRKRRVHPTVGGDQRLFELVPRLPGDQPGRTHRQAAVRSPGGGGSGSP